MGLIDADTTVKLIQIATAKELYEGEMTKRLGNSYNYHAIAAGYKAAIDDMTQAVKDAPTIDAVPVDKIHFTDLYLDGSEAIAVFKFGNHGITLRKKCEDFAPVVRCKDCRDYKQNPYSEGNEKMCMCWGDWIPTEPDDFCSHGEREDK